MVAELLQRSAPEKVDRVVYGSVVQDVAAPNIAREIVLSTPLPDATDAYSVTRACATSTQAVVDGAKAILLGDADIVVAGGAQRMYEQARFIDLLEQTGRFDRRLEGLPDKKGITERLAMEQGLTKPEVAVLLAYSKMNYFEAVVACDVPDDPVVLDRLIRYFPPILGERFPDAIEAHRLRREIIATAVAGDIADHIGPGGGVDEDRRARCNDLGPRGKIVRHRGQRRHHLF